MPTFAKVRNWRKFQHYTDRKPPWIKLHRELLDDFEYISLPLASKALAPLIWLLAAESEDGEVRVDFDWLAFRLRVTEKEAEQGVTPLIEKGFLECASKPLATRYQPATPEREVEVEVEAETKAEREREPPSAPLPEVKKAKKRKTEIPADFSISERVRRWAKEKKHEALEVHLESFVGKAKAKGYTYVDWDEAFMTAIRDNWAGVTVSSRADVKPVKEALAPSETREERDAAWKRQLESYGVTP